MASHAKESSGDPELLTVTFAALNRMFIFLFGDLKLLLHKLHYCGLWFLLKWLLERGKLT